MCKIIAIVSESDVLTVANELEKHDKINGIAFKFNSTGKKLIK